MPFPPWALGYANVTVYVLLPVVLFLKVRENTTTAQRPSLARLALAAPTLLFMVYSQLDLAHGWTSAYLFPPATKPLILVFLLASLGPLFAAFVTVSKPHRPLATLLPLSGWSVGAMLAVVGGLAGL